MKRKNKTTPVLKGFVTPGNKKQCPTISVWCPFCLDYHIHGWVALPSKISDGHRVAYCINPLSPFNTIGYFIEEYQDKEIKRLKENNDGGYISNSKECPNVRRWIERFLVQNPFMTLSDVSQGFYIDGSRRRRNLFLTNGMRSFARKMLCEQGVKQVVPIHPIKIKMVDDHILFYAGLCDYDYRIPFEHRDTVDKVI